MATRDAALAEAEALEVDVALIDEVRHARAAGMPLSQRFAMHGTAVALLLPVFRADHVDRGRHVGIRSFVRVDNAQVDVTAMVQQIELQAFRSRDRRLSARKTEQRRWDALAESDKEIMYDFCRGLTKKEVAAARGSHRRTMSRHVDGILQQLGADTLEQGTTITARCADPADWRSRRLSRPFTMTAAERETLAFLGAGHSLSETADLLMWERRTMWGRSHACLERLEVKRPWAATAVYAAGKAEDRITTRVDASAAAAAEGQLFRELLAAWREDREYFAAEPGGRPNRPAGGSLATFRKASRALTARDQAIWQLAKAGRTMHQIEQELPARGHTASYSVIGSTLRRIVSHFGAENLAELTAAEAAISPGTLREALGELRPLSRRLRAPEHRVLELAAAGYGDPGQIADVLGCTRSAVLKHIAGMPPELSQLTWEAAVGYFCLLRRDGSVPPPKATPQATAAAAAAVAPVVTAYLAAPERNLGRHRSESPLDPARRRAIRGALDVLPPERLHEWHLSLRGHSPHEIAQIVGSSDAVVMKHQQFDRAHFGVPDSVSLNAVLCSLVPDIVVDAYGDVAPPKEPLTAHERHTVDLFLAGYGRPQVAQLQFPGRSTADEMLNAQLKGICGKLGVPVAGGKMGTPPLVGIMAKSVVLDIHQGREHSAPVSAQVIPLVPPRSPARLTSGAAASAHGLPRTGSEPVTSVRVGGR